VLHVVETSNEVIEFRKARMGMRPTEPFVAEE